MAARRRAKKRSKSAPRHRLCANRFRLPSWLRIAKTDRNSKGPKTEEGKSRSRWNALKHGVLSQRLPVLHEDDSQTYTPLLENLRRDLNLGNALEEILVEKIAMAYWRLYIAYGYEAEFARSRGEFIVVADRMGGYANTIHRQLLQAMNELERLQRRRGGEAVPAPVNIEVNVNDLEEELTDGPQASWDLSRCGSLSTLMPGRLVGTGPPVVAGNDQAAFVLERRSGTVLRNEPNTGSNQHRRQVVKRSNGARETRLAGCRTAACA